MDYCWNESLEMLLKYKINIFFISLMVKLFLYSINCVYLCAEFREDFVAKQNKPVSDEPCRVSAVINEAHKHKRLLLVAGAISTTIYFMRCSFKYIDLTFTDSFCGGRSFNLILKNNESTGDGCKGFCWQEPLCTA